MSSCSSGVEGETNGYVRHPQLLRFRDTASPVGFIAAYVRDVHQEATLRGYRFDVKKISRAQVSGGLTVTCSQFEFEWHHLLKKLELRDPRRRENLVTLKRPDPHPIFHVIRGEIADWGKGISMPQKILQETRSNRAS